MTKKVIFACYLFCYYNYSFCSTTNAEDTEVKILGED